MKEFTIYTCPMHPEVQKGKPGACPVCGMDLEPRQSQVHKEASSTPYRNRFFISLGLTLLVMVLAMTKLVSGNLNQWLQLGLSTPVVLWGGFPFFKRGWQSIRNRSLNMFTLIALGTGTAFIFSLISTFSPAVFPAELKTTGGLIPIYFESAAVIITLVLLGQHLEHKAHQKTRKAIESLLEKSPSEALLMQEDGSEKLVPLCHVKVGDRLRVLPGAKVPVDGLILDGRSSLDESMMTGESLPQLKKMNDWVRAGTINLEGSFLMRAENVGENTLLSQIVHMVTEAQRSQAPVQKYADKVSSYFVPAVLFIAFLTFLGWFFLGPSPKLTTALVSAVSVLIIACPCALGLATPMSIMVGIGRGAKEGVLIKNAEALETFGKVETLVLDKTGTLTEGKPEVKKIKTNNGFDEKTLLTLIGSLQKNSEHPFGRALIQKAKEENIVLLPSSRFHNVPGKGVMGTVDKKALVMGTEDFFKEKLTPLGNLIKEALPYTKKGYSVSYVSIQNKPVGFIAFSDSLKPTTTQALKNLKKSGLRLIMLTGDKKETAEAIAKKLDLDEVISEVLPTMKGHVIKELKSKGKSVAMAGDGINDAPALAEAHVGVAMGTGTDVAMESAGITLLKGDLRGLEKARSLSQLTMRNIHQNLFFAFIYNVVGIGIAAGLLYPYFGLLLSPMIAALAMTFSSLSVIANALRLQSLKI